MAKFLGSMADSSDGAYCLSCTKPIADNENQLACSGVCGKSVHLECTQMTKSAMKAVEDYENILFHCDECITNSIKTVNNKVDGLYAILERIERNMKAIDRKIEEVGKKSSGDIERVRELFKPNGGQETVETFANVLKKIPKKVVLVKPKNSENSDSKKTVEAVKRHIDPKKIKVKAVSNISNGGAAIECGDDEAFETVKRITLAKMGDSFQVTEAKQRIPKLKIVGINEKLNEEEIKETLKIQKEFLINDAELKVIRVYEVKNKYYNAIVEMSTDSFAQCLTAGKVHVGWDCCKVYEEIPVMICMKCCGYYHIAKECKQIDIVCRKCGGNHKMIECTVEEPKCVNCSSANEKQGFKFDVKHVANDAKCAVRKQRAEVAKRRRERLQ